ncbi:DUF2637 domain-containing protein [Streptomyces luteireticuli]
MTRPTTAPLTATTVGASDRTAIVALGAAGCALSYDALQQMAVAIHVRGFLTYLFPLVIDGFIAYGVRALILTRTAPWHARAYVWMLFGTATAASIWANALHAVRLNQQAAHHGLRLGDTVVAILSTIAPLALAGAVHLYILITRHHPQPAPVKKAEPGGDRDLLLPGLAPAGDGDGRPRWRRLLTGPRTDRSTTGDRSAGSQAGPAAGTVAPPAGGDRDPSPAPNLRGDRMRDGDRCVDRDRNPGGGAVPVPDGNGTAVPEESEGRSETVPGAQQHTSTDRADGRQPGTDTGPVLPDEGRPLTGPTADEATGQHTGADTFSGTRAHRLRLVPEPRDGDRTGAVPGTASTRTEAAQTSESGRHGDSAGPVPDSREAAPAATVPDASGRKGTGASRSAPGKRRLTEDEIVKRLRPHVPAVLKRDGNGEVTRVQLREIMRAQDIAIRNDRLTPVLQRLRSETGSTTTRSNTR